MMIMGKCVTSKKYENYEYITAVMISLGMASFLFGQENTSAKGRTVVETTLPGIILLASYLACDSFTSNWQVEFFFSLLTKILLVNFFSGKAFLPVQSVLCANDDGSQFIFLLVNRNVLDRTGCISSSCCFHVEGIKFDVKNHNNIKKT